MLSASEVRERGLSNRPRGRPLLLGHRGARLAARENTLAAFDLALEHGCDGIEFDVRLTHDKHAVICHDEKLAGRSIQRSTYSQLCDRLGRKPRAAHAVLLPSLDDVLARFANRAWLDIEIKIEGFEQKLLNAVRRHGLQRKFFVSSFYPRVLEDLRARDPRLPLGVLTDNPRHIGLWSRFDVQIVIPHFKLVTASLVDEVHAAGRMLMTWTVNSPRDMKRFADLGVDGIISDDTELLKRTLG